MTASDPTVLDPAGLATRPAQVWGGVRLVPLVREEPITDLRLHRRLYGDTHASVNLGQGERYTAYVPHGFVADWTSDGSAAAYGTSLGEQVPPRVPVRSHSRLALKESSTRLRFLPLHLALEGYLALHFGGPTVVWEEWSQRAVRAGLSPRAEEAYRGAHVRGLAEALQVFEIHPGQCGVVLYVADALAAAFAVPHPEDYRALHPTLVLDLFGELIHHYALLSAPVPDFRAEIPGPGIRSLADLRAAAREQERAWAEFHDSTMAGAVFGAEVRMRKVHRMGRFTLGRFLPEFRPGRDNHIGETITDESGRLAYLKTFRLSEAQVRRGYLLDTLAAHDWHLASAATALGIAEAQLGLRLEAAGFGALLRQDVLDRYRRQVRTGQASASRRPSPR
ncbi:hypothetical protein [Kitasatospora sp. NPDC051914]|uniref:ARPP-2 domain-containing protein n=1 Tax=Kitasatospora sp. NPDC051914 TaxID=3154945 RepID=UPI0034337774